MVVKQLGRAWLKQPESMHIMVVPRVMTGRWRKHLTRGTDFYFRLDSGKVWPWKKHFEPLLIFSAYRTPLVHPDLPRKVSFWKNFEGLCCEKSCQKFLKCSDGIFCVNFLDA